MQSPGQMQSPTPRTRSSCTVPGLLVGLTKLCKLPMVCAAPSVGCHDAKIEFSIGEGLDQRLVLVRLFEAMASLKSAYVKMQRAHIPYDPAKIAFADEIITSELDSVTALQCLCGTSSGVGALVNERWSLLQELEAEMRKRDSDIVLLKRELERLQREKSRLNKQIKSKNSPVKRKKELATTPSEIVELFKVASRSVNDFAELLTSLMASSDRCVSDADAAERSWNRYSLEAHLAQTMLLGGGPGTEEESSAARFDRIMSFCDPLDALMQYPGSSFSRFCRTKYLAAVPSETEAGMFRNVDQRAFVSRGGHPRTCFYRAFAKMARPAWTLRVVMAQCVAARSVRMFYARRGSEYAEELMESVAAPALFGSSREGDGEERIRVAFTVTPGVKIGDTVVACRVFLCHHPEGFTQIQ